jgi:hypothetical protein
MPASGPWNWLKICVKMTATATGATMYGSRMLMRQNVLALIAWSSTAAMIVATMTCGTAERTKMLMVLRKAFQKAESVSTAM